MLAKSAAVPAIAKANRRMNLPRNGSRGIAFHVVAMPGKPGRLDDRPMARVGAGQVDHAVLLRDHKKFSQDENITNDGNNPVCSYGTIARRPREHKNAKKRLQLVRPEKASNAENQVYLYKYTKNQSIHGTSGGDH